MSGVFNLFDDLVCDECDYNQFKGHPDDKRGVRPITRKCNGCGRDLIEQRELTIEIAQAQIDLIKENGKHEIR